MPGWFDGPSPSTYKTSEPEPPRFPQTHAMTYDEVVEHVLELRQQIRSLEADASSAQSDLFARRLELIRTGKPVPDDLPLLGLPQWNVQQRKEQVAAENRAIDEEAARKDPGFKAPGS